MEPTQTLNTIKIKTTDSHELTLSATPDTTIAQLKRNIYEVPESLENQSAYRGTETYISGKNTQQRQNTRQL